MAEGVDINFHFLYLVYRSRKRIVSKIVKNHTWIKEVEETEDIQG